MPSDCRYSEASEASKSISSASTAAEIMQVPAPWCSAAYCSTWATNLLPVVSAKSLSATLHAYSTRLAERRHNRPSTTNSSSFISRVIAGLFASRCGCSRSIRARFSAASLSPLRAFFASFSLWLSSELISERMSSVFITSMSRIESIDPML